MLICLKINEIGRFPWKNAVFSHFPDMCHDFDSVVGHVAGTKVAPTALPDKALLARTMQSFSGSYTCPGGGRMIFITATMIGIAAGLIRSAFSVAMIAALIGLSFAVAAIVSPGPVYIISLLLAVV